MNNHITSELGSVPMQISALEKDRGTNVVWSSSMPHVWNGRSHSANAMETPGALPDHAKAQW